MPEKDIKNIQNPIQNSIQNHILSRLKNADVLRYSELYPKDHSSNTPMPTIPNDLFNYHLQQLVKKDFIVKNHKGYSLSHKAEKYVADAYPKDILFKINVITIISRVVDGKIEILNQIRKSHPSYGKVGVMGGVVLKGELIEDAASRKLKQETGLEARLKLVGCERRIMYKEGQLFSDLMFPITYCCSYASSRSGQLISDSDFGHNMWVPIDQAIKNESADFDSIKSINVVLRAIKDGSIKNLPFFFKEEIQR